MIKTKKPVLIAVVFLLLLLVLSGCVLKPFWRKVEAPAGEGRETGTPTEQNSGAKNILEGLSEQVKIKKFNSPAELKEFVARGTSRSGYGALARGMGGFALEDSVSSELGFGAPSAGVQPFGSLKKEAAESTAPGTSGQATAADFSRTNNQVGGVDEPDIIKTDGRYIYAASKNDLFIIEAYPAESAEIIARVELKAMPQDLFMAGDRLIVFGQGEIPEPLAAEPKPLAGLESGSIEKRVAPDRTLATRPAEFPVRRFSGTYFKVYDVSDKKNPKLVRDLAFEGAYLDARMIGDFVYFLTYHYAYGPTDTLLPKVIEGGKILAEPGLDVFYFDLPYPSYNFTRVSAINVKDDSRPAESDIYLMPGNHNIYVSEKNIYLTYTKYLSEERLVMEVAKEMVLPRLDQADREKIGKIEGTEDFILSPEEKLTKVIGIIEGYVLLLPAEEQTALTRELEERIKQKYRDIARELEKTVVHKIAVDLGKLEYKTYGEVPGSVLNQFSMDEQGDYFRVATTKNRTWSRYADQDENESYSNLYVLDRDLKIAGALENLAKGERIYSARFLGKRAYLVTFQQTDPLFAIDLSEPSNPKVLGELKIPGFSNYLHPYDDDTLIGFGRDTEANQWGGVTAKGLKLSLFDVSQVDKPVELDKYILGGQGSDSIALTDHHAFLFSRDKDLLVIPASIREGGGRSNWGRFTFSGAAVFSTEGKKFTLKSKIDHSDGGVSGVSELWYGYNFYDNTVRRSLYIGDTLYTFSDKYIKANRLETFAQVKTIALAKPSAAAIERDSRRLSDIKQIQTALELFFNDAGAYPAAVSSGVSIASGSVIYMAAVPKNPAPGGETYLYEPKDDGQSYGLTFALETATGGFTAGRHVASPSGIE